MNHFLSKVVTDLQRNNTEFQNTLCVLPSERSCLFLKNTFRDQIKSSFLPEIQPIKDFIATFSGLEEIDTVTLLFDFYKIYLKKKQENADDFITFSRWATTALQDFNDIDTYLIDTQLFFTDLKNIEKINHWGSEQTLKKSELLQRHYTFLSDLQKYYESLIPYLYDKKLATRGMMYRESVKKIKDFQSIFKVKQVIFIGFNALNKSEETLFKTLLNKGIAKIYWDTDGYYENKKAGVFFERYKKWDYYKKHPFNFKQNYFSKQKNITQIAAVKNITQVKTVANLIEKQENFSCSAWILCDESMFSMAVTSVPANIEQVNITKGYPLKNIPFAMFFEVLFKLYMNRSKQSEKAYYYKDIQQLLDTDFIAKILKKNTLKEFLLKENLVFVSEKDLQKILNQEPIYKHFIELLCLSSNKVDSLLKKLMVFLGNYRHCFKGLSLFYLQRFETLLKKLITLQNTYGFLKDFQTLYGIYRYLLRNETLSFKGKATEGLQIMGLLETSCLDFETLWFTSLNEGILPKSKNISSFIAYDVRIAYKLPTYQDRDAIFAYHFYRLIQRAKNIYLLYDTQTDSYGAGEKSRFLSQLEMDFASKISYKTVISDVPSLKKEPIIIEKSNLLMEKLKDIANSGFSPSALITYILNPLSYYKRYGLGIKVLQQVKETIEADTMGTIIHGTLEELYKSFVGKILCIEDIREMLQTFEEKIEEQYQKQKIYAKNGKNLLIKEISKSFVKRFLQRELDHIEKGKQIEIIALEQEIKIPLKGLQDIYIKGNLDRIDKIDGILRIVDYKTGKVEQKDLNVKDIDQIIKDYKYHKVFQVLCYGYLYTSKNDYSFDKELLVGIYSFRNFKEDFLKISINKDIIQEFSKYLEKLIREILDKKQPFIENLEAPY